MLLTASRRLGVLRDQFDGEKFASAEDILPSAISHNTVSTVVPAESVRARWLANCFLTTHRGNELGRREGLMDGAQRLIEADASEAMRVAPPNANPLDARKRAPICTSTIHEQTIVRGYLRRASLTIENLSPKMRLPHHVVPMRLLIGFRSRLIDSQRAACSM